MLPLSGQAFDVLALAWFTLLALAPRRVILFLSLGKSRISDTGVKVLRVLGCVFAVWSLASLILG